MRLSSAPMSDAPSTLIATNWGTRLRQRRVDQGLTQETFAELVGRDQTTISRYERGEGPWTPEAMLLLAVALDTTVSALFPWPVGIEEAEKFRQLTSTKPSAVAS